MRALRLRRPLLAALAAGSTCGLVIAGGGSRIAMRLVALADGREDFGLPTEAGATVGEVTFGGTFFILVLGTMLGVLGAFLYLGVRRWLPGRPAYRTLVFALLILGLGLGQTIRGNDGDFVFLDPAVSLLSFAAVLVLYALVVPPFVDRIAPRTIDHAPWGSRLVAVVVLAAVVFGAAAVKYALELANGSRFPG